MKKWQITDEVAERTIKRLGGVGILRPKDLHAFSEQECRILNRMADGRWYTRHDIEAIGEAADSMRRMRELRSVVKIARKRIENTVNWQYKILGARDTDRKQRFEKYLWDQEDVA